MLRLSGASRLLRRALFIQTEGTPNPNALKFNPGREVLGAGNTYDFPAITDAYCSPLAKRIFSVSGVQENVKNSN